MKRALVFGWVLQHKFATGVAAVVATLIFTACLVNRGGLSQAQFQTAVATHRLAEASLENSQLADADRQCRQAVEILDQLAARSKDPRVGFERAAALETLAIIQSAAGERDQADAFFRKATGAWARFLSEDQAPSAIRWRLARCLALHASLLSDSGRSEEAERILNRADTVCRSRNSSGTSDRRVDEEWVQIKNQLGLLCLKTARWPEALENFESAASTGRRLIDQSEAGADHAAVLISVLVNQARTYSAAKQPDAALRKIVEARNLAERLTSENPSIARFRDLAADLLEDEASRTGSDPPSASHARELLERAVAIRESLVAGTPENPGYLEKLADSCGMLAEAYLRAKSFAKAEDLQRRELLYQSRLEKEHPGATQFRFGRGRALNNLAQLLLERGRAAEALPLAHESAALLEGVYRQNVLQADHRRAASDAYWTLCALELDRKDHRAAAKSVAAYQLIEPNGFEEPHEAAGFLARCIALCRSDPSLHGREQDSLARSYADRAVAALRQAVKYGFRDLNELTNSHVYDPVRDRADFGQVVDEVRALDQALKEG